MNVKEWRNWNRRRRKRKGVRKSDQERVTKEVTKKWKEYMKSRKR